MTTATKKRALLVEDEFLILAFLEGMMRNLGYEIAATAATVEQGLAVLRSRTGIDIAVLDVNLNGASSYQLAEQLRAARIPVLFSTGYGRHGLDPAYKDWPVIQKPYSERELAAALQHLCR